MLEAMDRQLDIALAAMDDLDRRMGKDKPVPGQGKML